MGTPKIAMKRVMKSMKSMKAKKSMKKGGMRKKAMKKSVIARGRGAKARVFRGIKAKTSGGLKKTDLIKNKRGKIVSKKASLNGKKSFAKNGISKWAEATKKARKALNIKGFVPIGGSSAQGKALLAKVRSFLK